MKLIDLYSKIVGSLQINSNRIEISNLIVGFWVNGNIRYIENFDENGKEYGKWEIFYENGNLEWVQNYENGKAHGECKRFYENGNLAFIGNLKNGKFHGNFKSFSMTGDLKEIGKWKNNKQRMVKFMKPTNFLEYG